MLVAGLSWAIVARFEEQRELARRTNYAILLVVVGSFLFLTVDALVFIDEMHEEFDIVTGWQQVGARCVVVLFSVTFCGAITTWVFWGNRKVDNGHPAPNARADTNANATVAAKGACAYLGVAVIFTLIAGWISGTHCGVVADYLFSFALGIFMCIVGPAIVFVFVIRAAPGMNQRPDGAQQAREKTIDNDVSI